MQLPVCRLLLFLWIAAVGWTQLLLLLWQLLLLWLLLQVAAAG